jgi:hypothetical protein
MNVLDLPHSRREPIQAKRHQPVAQALPPRALVPHRVARDQALRPGAHTVDIDVYDRNITKTECAALVDAYASGAGTGRVAVWRPSSGPSADAAGSNIDEAPALCLCHFASDPPECYFHLTDASELSSNTRAHRGLPSEARAITPETRKAALNALCLAAQEGKAATLDGLIFFAAFRSKMDDSEFFPALAKALAALSQRRTIKQVCAQKGLNIEEPHLEDLRSVGAARKLALEGPNSGFEKPDRTLPTALELREARRAFCAAHLKNRQADLTDLVISANVIFSEDSTVSPDRTEQANAAAFIDVVEHHLLDHCH